MTPFAKFFPWLVASLGLLFLVPPATKSYSDGSGGGFNLEGYASLPVQEGGRFMPMDTVARLNLLLISGKQTFFEEKPAGPGKDDLEQVRQPAIKWLLDALSSFVDRQDFGGPVVHHKVFRIENEQVLQFLKLQPRSGLRYSYAEILPKLKLLMDKARELDEVKSAKAHDLYDTKLLELAQHVALFQQFAALRAPRVALSADEEDKDTWYPLDPFLPPNSELADLKRRPTALFHYVLLRSYADNDPKTFNEVLKKAHEILGKSMPPEASKVGFELFYNRFEPFHQASVLYAFAFLFACFSWMGWFKPLNRGAYALMLIAFLVHTFGLFARMYLQGRAFVFVTNLYSSAIFIGWGCAGVCLFMEFFYRNSIPVAVGSATAGISAGIIAHYLSLSGDTMKMMEAVLDTNFWLATHVTTVTLGYTATFVAGFIAIAYILLGVFSPFLNRKMEDLFASDPTATGGFFKGEVLGSALSKMMYGVICFATLLSFTGTVLGGIWADQSWGRFWGWDPKENGALLIVIWNALILHARWGGMIKQRGMANLAVAGNIVTSWSWFGTNLLGVGLHSYGFTSGTVAVLLAFVATQLAVIGIGLVPTHLWASFRQPETV